MLQGRIRLPLLCHLQLLRSRITDQRADLGIQPAQLRVG